MSVGGKVIEVVWNQTEDRKWVNTKDQGGEECAINVDPKCPVKIGDSLWWQGSIAFHTIYKNGKRSGKVDTPYLRFGFSGVNRPS